jgi:hypothetical protein
MALKLSSLYIKHCKAYKWSVIVGVAIAAYSLLVPMVLMLGIDA